MTLDTMNSGMIKEIEEFLKSHVKRTAHHLVSKTTDELVREALNDVPPVESTRPTLALPSAVWKFLPGWVVSARRIVRSNVAFEIDAREHIRLMIEVIERWGWADSSLRTVSGRRCMLGAQLLLVRMGYGTDTTVNQAGCLIQDVLYKQGVRDWYWHWNDESGRTKDQVISVLRKAMK